MSDALDPADARGLVCAYDLDGQGAGRRLDWADLVRPAEAGHSRWIHLDFRNAEAARWVREESGADALIADALLDDDSRPRVVEHDGGLLMILRGVNTNPGADPEDMVSVRLWIEPGRVVSTRRRRLLSVQSLRDDLDAGRGARDPADLLVILVGRLMDRVEPVIDSIDEAIEEAESAFEGSRVTAYRGEFSSLRRQAVRIRRFLAPQREALERASRHEEVLDERQRLALREEADHVTRNLEDLDLIRERAMVAQEELLAQLAQEQNSRMYILSIVAAIFLPLSFVTGLMGMNVAGLPGLDYPYAFLVVCAMMLAAAVGILVYFRWRRWV